MGKRTQKQIDHEGVDRFAIAMKTKLDRKRLEGRRGWNDHTVCSTQDLAAMLVEHVIKGDPVDIANFCMMLHMRGCGLEIKAAAEKALGVEEV